jgi:hypothetical protein
MEISKNTFNETFNEWEALAYLKGYKSRRLAVFFIPGLTQFVNHYPKRSMDEQYQDDQDIKEYIAKTEEELMAELPF